MFKRLFKRLAVLAFAGLGVITLSHPAGAQLGPASPTVPAPGVSSTMPAYVAPAAGAADTKVDQGAAGTAPWLATANQGTAGTTPWPTVVYVAGAAVSGSNPVPVAVQNFPATQPVSATALPLPSGASTAANQSSEIAALGTTGDTAYSGSGSASIVAALKGVYTATLQPLAAGSAIVGKAGIDQTTPGTTNGVVVNSSALPSGAATSANQTSEIAAVSGRTSYAWVGSTTFAASATLGDQQYVSLGASPSAYTSVLATFYSNQNGTYNIQAYDGSVFYNMQAGTLNSGSMLTVKLPVAVVAASGTKFRAYIANGSTAATLATVSIALQTN